YRQDRECRITVEKSDGRFGSDFRLVSSQNGSSHFVFLDSVQLHWMEGVVSVAAENDWVFPLDGRCVTQNRIISATKFQLHGAPVVKVYERCRNGKIFFVIFPKEQARGWMALLRVLKGGIEESVTKRSGAGSPSYAQVVAKKVMPQIGKCRRATLEGMDMIRVEEDGVEERLQFLRSCLVFRFEKLGLVNWVEFRSWANHQWGVSTEAEILHVGDDVWLLVCTSEVEVQRILCLNRHRSGI
ncbi:hypothetical protein LINGRAHAP2_LOCUS4609, partial [Linum grandiflorum]